MDNVISFQFKRRELGKGICEHNHITIDDNMIVECTDCGDYINPAQYIYSMARKESRLKYRITELKQEIEKLKNHLRVKCIHCGQVTPISNKVR